MTPLRERRVARRLFVAAALVSLLCISVRAQQSEPGTLPDAMRFLAHEKSAAEQYAVILSTVAKNDACSIRPRHPALRRCQGGVRRVDCGAADSSSRRAGAGEVGEVQRGAKGAAEKRIAFTSFVSSEVEKLDGTARAAGPDPGWCRTW